MNLKDSTKVTSVNSKMYIIGIKAKYNEELLLEKKIELISKEIQEIGERSRKKLEEYIVLYI